MTIWSVPRDPYVGLDGRLGAPAGIPQFQTLLISYLIRPPWQVAGVDYAVGLKSNVSVDTSTDVITITGTQNNHINGQKVSFRTVNGGTLPGGVSLDTAYFVVNVSGNTFKVSATSGGAAIDLTGSPSNVVVLKIPVAAANSMPAGVVYASGQSHTGSSLESVTPTGASDASNGSQSATGTINIDSYDFSWDTTGAAQHGISISTGGFNGTVNVTNCYFKTGDWLQCWIWQNTTASDTYNLTYNDFDGGGLLQFGNTLRNLQHGLYNIPGGTWRYNWLHNILAPVLASPSSPYTMQFNVTNNIHYGIASNHVDGMFPSFASDISNSIQSWNLVYQPAATTFGNGNGYPAECDTSIGIFLQPNASLTLTGIVIESNVVIGIGTTGHMNTLTQTGGFAMAEVFLISPNAGNTIDNITIKNNYIDSTGIHTDHFIISDNGSAGTVSNKHYSGNLSLTTGATIVPNVKNTQ